MKWELIAEKYAPFFDFVRVMLEKKVYKMSLQDIVQAVNTMNSFNFHHSNFLRQESSNLNQARRSD